MEPYHWVKFSVILRTLELIVRTQDVVWKTYWEQWMIGMDGERELEISMLSVRLDVNG